MYNLQLNSKYYRNSFYYISFIHSFRAFRLIAFNILFFHIHIKHNILNFSFSHKNWIMNGIKYSHWNAGDKGLENRFTWVNLIQDSGVSVLKSADDYISLMDLTLVYCQHINSQTLSSLTNARQPASHSSFKCQLIILQKSQIHPSSPTQHNYRLNKFFRPIMTVCFL